MMPMLGRLFKEATGFHKATCLLASKFTGVKYYDADAHLPFPMLLRRADGVLVRSIFSDEKADERWQEDAESYFPALIVNAAFSLELHLKHLHLLIEEKQVRGHDLFKLFQGLSEYTRVNLEAIFQAVSASQPLIAKSFEGMKAELGIVKEWSIRAVLQESARAFEAWRYRFEGSASASSFVGYGQAVYAMRIMSTRCTIQRRASTDPREAGGPRGGPLT